MQKTFKEMIAEQQEAKYIIFDTRHTFWESILIDLSVCIQQVACIFLSIWGKSLLWSLISICIFIGFMFHFTRRAQNKNTRFTSKKDMLEYVNNLV